jgi:hypothetical protein
LLPERAKAQLECGVDELPDRTPSTQVRASLTSDLATDAVVRHFEPAYRLHAAVSPMTLYLECSNVGAPDGP